MNEMPISAATIAINLIDQEGRVFLATSNHIDKKVFNINPGKNLVSFNVQNVFPEGTYTVSIAIASKNEPQSLLYKDTNSYKFYISPPSRHKHSLTYPDVDFTITPGR